jgi:isopenicillin N synthase-like dioxygenase
MELGVVDLDAPLDEQVRTMADACETLGFFRVPCATIDTAVAEAAWVAAAAFFALPEDAKHEVAFPEPGYPYGYSPYRHETLARSLDDTEARPDLKESFSVGPDCGAAPPPDDPDQAWIRSPSLWPSALPELRPAWTAYYRALSGVAERLMSVMALALELPADHFAPLIDRPITSMRALHYPAADATDDPADGALRAGAHADGALRAGAHADGALRAGAHADYGTLTILRTDHVGGLQIVSPDGDWVDVVPDPDMFVVNLGDSIAQWTNDRWRSTLHRVVPRPEPRQSMAFFHMANWDATIEALPGCVAPGATPRHAPVDAGPWLMRKFQATVT